MLLLSGATKTAARYCADPRLGVLLRPGNGNRPGALPWAVDNGAFANFDECSFLMALQRFQEKPGCLWVAAPDIVGNALATLQWFDRWEPMIRERGFPVALVAQDGLDSTITPWSKFECLFIGGSTEFKLGSEARTLIIEAKQRGKIVHMGRVNTLKRMRYAHDLGVDSIDGTQWSRFGDTYIGWGLNELARLEGQPPLYSVVKRVRKPRS